MKNSKYSDKLRDPRWQKKRLEIFKRDNFTCVLCGDDSSTLAVHHMRYMRRFEPWEYPDEYLVTLCSSCHELEYECMKDALESMTDALARSGFFSSGISDIANGIAHMRRTIPSEVSASIISWAVSNEEMMDEMQARFFSESRERRNNKKQKVNHE